jgi:hypothetical protein
MVGEAGVEPAHLAVLDPKSSASANSATRPRRSLARAMNPLSEYMPTEATARCAARTAINEGEVYHTPEGGYNR